MVVKKAVQHFHGPEKYSCAQSILKAFEGYCEAIDDETIAAFKNFSGGRAEGGLCGALFAAEQLVDDAESIQLLRQRFLDAAGSVTCREIRKLKRCSCEQCVELAAGILHDISGDKKLKLKLTGPARSD